MTYDGIVRLWVLLTTDLSGEGSWYLAFGSLQIQQKVRTCLESPFQQEHSFWKQRYASKVDRRGMR